MDSKSTQFQMNKYQRVTFSAVPRIQLVAGKPVVPIIGITGSGKSTIINYLKGMLIEKHGQGRLYPSRLDTVGPSFARIGHTTGQSTTFYIDVFEHPIEIAMPKNRIDYFEAIKQWSIRASRGALLFIRDPGHISETDNTNNNGWKVLCVKPVAIQIVQHAVNIDEMKVNTLYIRKKNAPTKTKQKKCESEKNKGEDTYFTSTVKFIGDKAKVGVETIGSVVKSVAVKAKDKFVSTAPDSKSGSGYVYFYICDLTRDVVTKDMSTVTDSIHRTYLKDYLEKKMSNVKTDIDEERKFAKDYLVGDSKYYEYNPIKRYEERPISNQSRVYGVLKVLKTEADINAEVKTKVLESLLFKVEFTNNQNIMRLKEKEIILQGKVFINRETREPDLKVKLLPSQQCIYQTRRKMQPGNIYVGFDKRRPGNLYAFYCDSSGEIESSRMNVLKSEYEEVFTGTHNRTVQGNFREKVLTHLGPFEAQFIYVLYCKSASGTVKPIKIRDDQLLGLLDNVDFTNPNSQHVLNRSMLRLIVKCMLKHDGVVYPDLSLRTQTRFAFPLEELKKGVILCDTPGTGDQNVSYYRSGWVENAFEWLRAADVKVQTTVVTFSASYLTGENVAGKIIALAEELMRKINFPPKVNVILSDKLIEFRTVQSPPLVSTETNIKLNVVYLVCDRVNEPTKIESIYYFSQLRGEWDEFSMEEVSEEKAAFLKGFLSSVSGKNMNTAEALKYFSQAVSLFKLDFLDQFYVFNHLGKDSTLDVVNILANGPISHRVAVPADKLSRWFELVKQYDVHLNNKARKSQEIKFRQHFNQLIRYTDQGKLSDYEEEAINDCRYFVVSNYNRTFYFKSSNGNINSFKLLQCHYDALSLVPEPELITTLLGTLRRRSAILPECLRVDTEISIRERCDLHLISLVREYVSSTILKTQLGSFYFLVNKMNCLQGYCSNSQIQNTLELFNILKLKRNDFKKIFRNSKYSYKKKERSRYAYTLINAMLEGRYLRLVSGEALSNEYKESVGSGQELVLFFDNRNFVFTLCVLAKKVNSVNRWQTISINRDSSLIQYLIAIDKYHGGNAVSFTDELIIDDRLYLLINEFLKRVSNISEVAYLRRNFLLIEPEDNGETREYFYSHITQPDSTSLTTQFNFKPSRTARLTYIEEAYGLIAMACSAMGEYLDMVNLIKTLKQIKADMTQKDSLIKCYIEQQQKLKDELDKDIAKIDPESKKNKKDQEKKHSKKKKYPAKTCVYDQEFIGNALGKWAGFWTGVRNIFGASVRDFVFNDSRFPLINIDPNLVECKLIVEKLDKAKGLYKAKVYPEGSYKFASARVRLFTLTKNLPRTRSLFGLLHLRSRRIANFSLHSELLAENNCQDVVLYDPNSKHKKKESFPVHYKRLMERLLHSVSVPLYAKQTQLKFRPLFMLLSLSRFLITLLKRLDGTSLLAERFIELSKVFDNSQEVNDYQTLYENISSSYSGVSSIDQNTTVDYSAPLNLSPQSQMGSSTQTNTQYKNEGVKLSNNNK